MQFTDVEYLMLEVFKIGPTIRYLPDLITEQNLIRLLKCIWNYIKINVDIRLDFNLIRDNWLEIGSPITRINTSLQWSKLIGVIVNIDAR